MTRLPFPAGLSEIPRTLALILLALTTTSAAGVGAADAAGACSGGLVHDDGSAESGYGWVPSIAQGIYVQRFDPPPQAVGGEVTEVCLCWLRTREDDRLDFELVVYRAADDASDDRPAESPVMVLPAVAAGVPLGLGGRFYSYAIPRGAVPLEDGPLYVGARWSAARDGFFFLCADRSPATPITELFFRDELSRGWTSAATAADPIFEQHRAAMVRLGLRTPPAVAIPGLSGWGLALLSAGLVVAASKRLRRRD